MFSLLIIPIIISTVFTNEFVKGNRNKKSTINKVLKVVKLDAKLLTNYIRLKS